MGKGAVGEKRGEGVKIVAISGATGGIGRALARAYAKPGVMLLLAGRRLDVLTDTKAFCERLGAKVEIDAYDVRDEAATVRWCRKAAALGAVRLILAAGVSASVEEVRNHADEAAYYLPERMDDLKRELDVNAVANILACNAFVRAVMQSNVRTREHAAGGFSAGAVADDEHTALLRDERRERSFEREGAGTRHQDSGVFGGTHARDTQETTAHVLHHRDECGISGRRTAGHGLEDGCFNGDGAGREQPAGIDLSFHDLQRSFVQSRMRGIIERLHDETTADE